jgi:hypothetical protein
MASLGFTGVNFLPAKAEIIGLDHSVGQNK